MSRWVVVDDARGTDIVYGGVWSVIDGTLDGIPTSSGPPLYNTLHGAHSNASISYTFKGKCCLCLSSHSSPAERTAHLGSSFVVVGSHFSTPVPQWTCSIDGQELATSLNGSDGNNLQLCAKTLADGTHTVVLDVLATEDEPFWFDYIQFLPSTDMSLDQADIVYGTDDSLIQCDSEWDPMQVGTMTMRKGSTMVFDFNGVSVSWFGVYNNSHARDAAVASYSVDGETAIPFVLENKSSDDTPLLSNQPFFHTSKYPAGQHRLQVVYQGQPEMTPLTLEHLIVQDSSPNSLVTTSTVTATATSTMSSIVTTSRPSQSSNHSGGTNSRLIGSIVGGAIGGFLFLGLLAMAFFFHRRCSLKKRRTRHPEAAFRDVIEPYTHNPLLRSSGYHALPTSTAKRPILLGNIQTGPETPVSRTGPRRSIIQTLVGRFTSATFGSTHTHDEGSTLLSSDSSRHTRTRTSSSWVVVVHEDSGFRLLPNLPRITTDVVEIPPTYSAE